MPIGPGPDEEAAFAEQDDSGPVPYDAPGPSSPEARPPVGNLDELVGRIPGQTRDALHELLRARFTRVRRVRDGELR